MTHRCQYCEREFRRESSLAVHVCEPKMRWQQESETGVQLGLQAYLRFYETTQGSAKLKTYADFVASPYYNAFVKFGRYCQDIRCINFRSYLDWLLKHNKKIDHWCRDSMYAEWMPEYIRHEAVSDALERAFKEMQNHADAHPELRNGFRDYFRFGGVNRICHHITTGRISPWVVFNCSSGISYLDGLGAEQLQIVMPYVDPDFWQRKFTDYMADTLWIKDILEKAGL